MRATMAAVAALAGGLFLLATTHGPASATSVPINLKNVIGTTPGSVELVRQGGGGGGGGHGGGGGRYSGGGGGGGGAAMRAAAAVVRASAPARAAAATSPIVAAAGTIPASALTPAAT